MNAQAKTLIIGQGLAGSLLAYQLVRQGLAVFVIDQAHRESSSMAAAGLVNPVTGKRIAKSWLLEKLYPTAISLYQELEERFKKKFFYPCQAVRLYKNEFERERIEDRRTDPGYTPWISQKDTEGTPLPIGNREGFSIFGTGWVDIPTLLESIREWLTAQDAYSSGHFDTEELAIHNDGVFLKSEKFERIVFCEGYQAKDNPLFSWLPFKPAKGEILSLKTDTAKQLENTLVNQGKWVLPVNNQIVKVGATYCWDPLDCEPTESAKKELIRSYEELIPNDPEAEIKEHKAGVRPATLDAKPFLGVHPEHERALIFNGFGSKGSLLIPYFSQHFAEVILGDEALMPEVDILRYWKTH